MRAVVRGVGVWGPGLPGWEAARAVLAGRARLDPGLPPLPAPAILPAAERRRAGPVVRLALAVAQEATSASGIDPARLPSIFASANGDGPVVHAILEALAASPDAARAVSPTQFHNSVHNAAAGYWTIAHRACAPADCVGAHDWSWAAGLLRALVEVATTAAPVLLVCYDQPLPPPLDRLRPVPVPFGVGLVLSPAGEGPRLEAEYQAVPPRPAPLSPDLQALTDANPAARAVPLLAALAEGGERELDVPYLEGRIALTLG